MKNPLTWFRSSHLLWDPPKGDYYSRPSQPKYVATGEYTPIVEPPEKVAAIYGGGQVWPPADFGATSNEFLSAAFKRGRADVDAAAYAAAFGTEELHCKVARRLALERQAYQEPFAVRHYFWLGSQAENL